MGEGRQFRNPITGWWERQAEPRWVTPLIMVFYLSAFVAGLVALIDGPAFLQLGLGDYLLELWAGFCIVGGALGVYGAARGLNFLERGALIACGAAVALYIATLIDLSAQVEQNFAWRAAFDVGLLAMMGIRFLRVRHGLRDPERYSSYRPDPTIHH